MLLMDFNPIQAGLLEASSESDGNIVLPQNKARILLGHWRKTGIKKFK